MTLALFIPGQPWRIRWRLFILRDVARCVITIVRWFRATPKPLPLRIHIPSRDAGRMILVHAYVPYTTERKIDYPVHVNLYGGAFFGGNGRDDDFFCARIARDVGAVVLCPNYRLAPEHIFPAGLEDVEDTLAAVLSSTISIPSRPEIVLSSTRLTVSGFSAGGALALAASALDPFPRLPALLNLQHALKGVVLYYGVLDLRVSPQQKVIPQKIIEMSKRDPVGKMVVVLEPLYTDNHNPRITEQWRCSPTLMPASYIPRNLTILAPELDPLADEEEKFVQRVRKESDEHGLGIKIDYRKYKGCLHGWTHLPKFVNGEEAERMKQEALTAGVEAIKRALFGE